MRRRPLIVLLCLLVLLFAAPFLLVFTETGTRLVLQAAQRVAPLELEQPSGTLAGRLTVSTLRLRLEDVDLTASGVALSLDHLCLWRSAVCLPDLEAASLRLDWQDGQLALGLTELDLVLSEGAITLNAGSVENPLLQLTDTGQPAERDRISLPTIELPFALRIDELRLVNGRVALNDEHHAFSELRLTGYWQGESLALDTLYLDAGELGLLDARDIALAMRDEWPLAAHLDVTAGTDFPWEQLRGRSAVIEAAGSAGALSLELAAAGAPAITATLEVDLLDPALPFSTEASARDLEQLELPGTDEAPTALADLTLDSPLRLSAQGDLERQNFSLEGGASTAGYGELRLLARGSHTDGLLTIDAASVSDIAGNSQLMARGELSFTEGFAWSMQLNSPGLTLEPLNPSLTGRIAGSLASRGQAGENAWQTWLEAIDLHGEVNGLPASLAGYAALDSEALLTEGDLRADLNGARLALSPVENGSGATAIDIEVDELRRWHARAAGEFRANVLVGPRGERFRVEGSGNRLRFADATAVAGRFTADYDRGNNGAFTLRTTLESAALGNTAFSQIDLDATGNHTEQSLRLAVRGDLEGQLAIAGRGGLPGWTGRLAATTLQGDTSSWSLPEPVDIEWDGAALSLQSGPLLMTRLLNEGERSEVRLENAAINARFDDGLILDADIRTGPAAGLALAAHLPQDPYSALSGTLRVNDVDIAVLGRLLPSLGELRGVWNGELALSGAAAEPKIAGALNLSGGRVSLPGNPTVLEDIELRLQASGDYATLKGRGTLGGGDFAVNGRLAMQPEPTLDLTLSGSRHALIYPPSVDVLASQDLRVVVSTTGIRISGDVTIHEGEFRFEQLPEGGVNLSSDVVRVDIENEGLAEDLGLGLDLDVGILIEQGFKLTGALLETGLTGQLRVRQNPRSTLQVFGTLTTRGGTVRAYDRVLVIRRGSVSFNGNPANPLIDLRAERRVSGTNVTAGLHAHGALADNLTLDVYADPPMSEGNAMSYLLWGRSMDSGTSSDGTVMALSLAGSVVNRSSLVSAINDVPGISDIRLSAEGSDEDAAATVGGFVGQRLYLSYGIGLYEPINVMTVRLFIQTRLWLEVVSRLENSVDLYYAFDIY